MTLKNRPASASLIKRYLFLAIGLFILAMGVAFSIKADLGTSPISSVPYVISLFTPLTVGQVTILMHCVFIALQILILRKDYDPIQLMQLPVAFVFGYMTDLCLWIIQNVNYTAYWQQLLFCTIGIVLGAIGVSFEVVAGVVTLAGEGLILAIAKRLSTKFGSTKIVFDTTLVVIACILSFVFLSGLYGVREGTVAAAIFIGLLSKYINPRLEPVAERFFS